MPAIGSGDKAVGLTLMKALGLTQTSSRKVAICGVVIGARRFRSRSNQNRVNLFARVPDWNLSSCKSSRELAGKYGYVEDGKQKLFCTLSARRPNSQGLQLRVSDDGEHLEEVWHGRGAPTPVATWRMSDLKQRLLESHPESLWVAATTVRRFGHEFFHYRHASYVGRPKPGMLGALLRAGTVTVDHLISEESGRFIEKGPLFKLKPDNFATLFGAVSEIDLMEL
jgi:hypothetical protein